MLASVAKCLALTALTGSVLFGSVDVASAYPRHPYYGHRHYHHGYRHYGYYSRPRYYHRWDGCVPLFGVVSGDFCN